MTIFLECLGNACNMHAVLSYTLPLLSGIVINVSTYSNLSSLRSFGCVGQELLESTGTKPYLVHSQAPLMVLLR